MTQEECEQREWPHGNGCRYTTGFLCEDCGTFLPKDSPAWLRFKFQFQLQIVLWNIGGKESELISEELKKVPHTDSQDERDAMLNRALLFIARNRKTPDDYLVTMD